MSEGNDKIKEINDHPFWMDRYEILWEYPEEWLPEMYLPSNRRKNAFVRVSIYLSLIVLMFTGSVNSLILPLVVMVITGITNGIRFNQKESQETQENQEGFSNHYNQQGQGLDNTGGIGAVGTNVEPKYVKPDTNNPFMNPLLTDYLTQPNREAENKNPDSIPEAVASATDDAFHYNLYRDVSDVYDRMNSQRQFYQVPNTTIPNDQTAFAEWLYKTPPTCKEGNGLQCVANNFDSPRFGSREVILA